MATPNCIPLYIVFDFFILKSNFIRFVLFYTILAAVSLVTKIPKLYNTLIWHLVFHKQSLQKCCAVRSSIYNTVHQHGREVTMPSPCLLRRLFIRRAIIRILVRSTVMSPSLYVIILNVYLLISTLPSLLLSLRILSLRSVFSLR